MMAYGNSACKYYEAQMSRLTCVSDKCSLYTLVTIVLTRFVFECI